MHRLEFAKRVNVWFTFISGVIVSRDTLVRTLIQQSIRRYSGTRLVQLGWVFPVLKEGSKFLFVEDRCILATRDNTGGYALLTTFGTNFARIVRTAFAADKGLADVLIGRTVTRYLPGIIWNSRWFVQKRFSDEDPWPAMREQLGSNPLYWLLLIPLGRFPRLVATPIFHTWRVFNRACREIDRIALSRQTGSAK